MTAGVTTAKAGENLGTYDVVVYGGTAGGVVAAVSAKDEGKTVALVEARKNLGGMVSGGLGATDIGKEGAIGGRSRDFYAQIGKYYGTKIGWRFEPHVAEQLFEKMIKTADVPVFRNNRLASVTKADGKIQSITFTNGNTIEGKIFIDATYEGDLMAAAKVPYHTGREGVDDFGESLAGVRAKTPSHNFGVNVNPLDESGNMLPQMTNKEMGKPGSADKRIQAYNFRLCMSSDPNNSIPVTKPENYDPARYELLARMLEQQPDIKLSDLMIISGMPNKKTDINNKGGFSTDHIGANYDYPDGDQATRDRIWQDHVDYTKGLLYFLGNDERVPSQVRDAMKKYGYAKDEYVDNGNFSHQLYVREARRMVGDYFMTEKDVRTERTKPDAVGMGSYNIDSHNVQRYIDPKGFARNEGDVQVGTQPYQIPYRAITPKETDCANLLVPVCVSSTHVAYGTIRMEPVFMLLGHAAGVAASQALDEGAAVQKIDVPKLQKKLLEQGQVLEYVPTESDLKRERDRKERAKKALEAKQKAASTKS